MKVFLKFWLQCLSVTAKTILHIEGVVGVLLPLFGAIYALYGSQIIRSFGYQIEIVAGSNFVLLASLAMFIFRMFLLAPYQVATRKPDMFTPRYNTVLNKAFWHVALRKCLTWHEMESDDYELAYNALRQAAVDGDVIIWGRPFQHGSWIEGISLPPLIPIRKEYWVDIGFDYSRLLDDEVLDRTDNFNEGYAHPTDEKYDELKVDMRQVQKRWKKANLVYRVFKWKIFKIKEWKKDGQRKISQP